MKTFKIKLIALMLMTGVMSATTFAQNITAPPKVQTAFSAKFPQVQLKNWKMENGQYVASFVMDRRDCEAAYDDAGNWMSTLIIYNHVYRHLTPVMRDELRNGLYAGYHLDQAKGLQMPNMDMLLLTLDNDNGNMSAYEDAGFVDMTTVYFNHSGR
jgi:hypothetical protein